MERIRECNESYMPLSQRCEPAMDYVQSYPRISARDFFITAPQDVISELFTKMYQLPHPQREAMFIEFCLGSADVD